MFSPVMGTLLSSTRRKYPPWAVEAGFSERRTAISMNCPPLPSVRASAWKSTCRVLPLIFSRTFSRSLAGIFWSGGGALSPSSTPSSTRPPLALAKATHSFASALQSEFFPRTARSDLVSSDEFSRDIPPLYRGRGRFPL